MGNKSIVDDMRIEVRARVGFAQQKQNGKWFTKFEFFHHFFVCSTNTRNAALVHRFFVSFVNLLFCSSHREPFDQTDHFSWCNYIVFDAHLSVACVVRHLQRIGNCYGLFVLDVLYVRSTWITTNNNNNGRTGDAHASAVNAHAVEIVVTTWCICALTSAQTKCAAKAQIVRKQFQWRKCVQPKMEIYRKQLDAFTVIETINNFHFARLNAVYFQLFSPEPVNCSFTLTLYGACEKGMRIKRIGLWMCLVRWSREQTERTIAFNVFHKKCSCTEQHIFLSSLFHRIDIHFAHSWPQIGVFSSWTYHRCRVSQNETPHKMYRKRYRFIGHVSIITLLRLLCSGLHLNLVSLFVCFFFLTEKLFQYVYCSGVR